MNCNLYIDNDEYYPYPLTERGYHHFQKRMCVIDYPSYPPSLPFEAKDGFLLNISTISNAGIGCFSLKDYKKGELIGKYYDRPDIKKVGPSVNKYIFCGRYNEDYNPSYDNSLRFINDIIDYDESCIQRKVIKRNITYNVDWGNELYDEAPYIEIIAIQDINKGAELFIDYCVDYWKYRIQQTIRNHEVVLNNQQRDRFVNSLITTFFKRKKDNNTVNLVRNKRQRMQESL